MLYFIIGALASPFILVAVIASIAFATDYLGFQGEQR